MPKIFCSIRAFNLSLLHFCVVSTRFRAQSGLISVVRKDSAASIFFWKPGNDFDITSETSNTSKRSSTSQDLRIIQTDPNQSRSTPRNHQRYLRGSEKSEIKRKKPWSKSSSPPSLRPPSGPPRWAPNSRSSWSPRASSRPSRGPALSSLTPRSPSSRFSPAGKILNDKS